MEYALELEFTKEQLRNIKDAGSRVVIAKQCSGGEVVAWQAFRPMQVNSVEWEELFGIYASHAQVVHGAELNQVAWEEVGAAPDKLYTLLDDGFISGPGADGEKNAFALKNKFESVPIMTVGLYQNAKVNGSRTKKSAISAAAVLTYSTAFMTPYTKVSVWLQSDVNPNTVVTRVTSPVSNFTFGGGKNRISLMLDSENGRFYEVTKL